MGFPTIGPRLGAGPNPPVRSATVPSERSCDLAVAGAGPAGVATALTARTAGLDVVLIDKATFPRDKTCGDGLTAAALRHLEHLGLAAPELPGYAPVSECVVVSPSGRRVVLRLPTDGEHAGVVSRRDLDAALVDLARERGVEVREGAAVVDVEDEVDGVTVRTAALGLVRAPYLVAADGHFSTVRRILQPHRPKRLGTWHAFRQYWSEVNDPRLWVLFEPDLLPGYAWVFPLPGGRANVGFGVLRGPELTGKELAARWRDLLGRPTLRRVLGDGRPERPHRAWPIPGHLEVDELTARRVLYVGDAAGVVDPLTGEGIAQALETGILAAEAVVAGGWPESVTDRYRHSVERALGADLRLAALLQRVLARPLGTRAALRAVDLTPWTRRQFARWMFEDYPRAVLGTPRRWRTQGTSLRQRRGTAPRC